MQNNINYFLDHFCMVAFEIFCATYSLFAKNSYQKSMLGSFDLQERSFPGATPLRTPILTVFCVYSDPKGSSLQLLVNKWPF
jgi:hypothetical protein